MKRLLFLGVVAAMTVGLALLYGCSTSTEPTNKLTGDTTDAMFQAAANVFDDADGYDQMMIYSIFNMSDQITTPQVTANPKNPGVPGIAAVAPVLPIYHEASQYWYLGSDTSLATDLDTLMLSLADSLQFLHGTTPVQYPDPALLTSIKSGARFSMTTVAVPDTIIVTQNVTVSGAAGAIAGRGTVQISGLGMLHGHVESLAGPSDSLPSCAASFSFANTWNSVTVNVASVVDSGLCPTAGTVAHVGTLNVGCANGQNSLQFSGIWSMLETFSGDIATVVYESPTTRWTVTDTCGQRPILSPLVKLPEFLGGRR
jgi:hypothetical protein